jgi:DNA-directed RNA polymerase specialized sigma24 family protein
LSADPLHGYDPDRIGAMAMTVVTRHPSWWTEGTRNDHFEAAYGGIAEALLRAESPPSPLGLYRAGQKALRAWVHAESRYRGRRVPAIFTRYWEPVLPADPQDIATDRADLARILAVLSPRQREAVIALAEHGSFAAAAEATGIPLGTYKVHVARARAKFAELWDAA